LEEPDLESDAPFYFGSLWPMGQKEGWYHHSRC
jgi:hypothetical protein